MSEDPNEPQTPGAARRRALVGNTDAMAWAEEFVRTARENSWSLEDVLDEGLMVGWFANAMMAVKDAAIRTQVKQRIVEPVMDEDEADGIDRFDIGHGHAISWYTRGPDDVRVGALIWHRALDNDDFVTDHAGGIYFDVPEAEGLTGARWTLHSLDPLHVEPSILCECGDHGFIRDGRWVPA
jgi:hypothetical protein